MTAHPHHAPTEFVFQPPVYPLHGAALMVALFLGALVVGNFAPLALIRQLLLQRLVSSRVGNPLAPYGGQGNGALAVVAGSRGQDAADGNTAVRGINVELVTYPAALVTLAVFLRPHITSLG